MSDGHTAPETIEFVGHKFDGHTYVEAVLQTSGPKWDVLAVLFKAEGGDWTFSGRTRIHMDAKAFDSADKKHRFEYTISATVSGGPLLRAQNGMAILWRLGGIEAMKAGVVPATDLPVIVLEKPDVLSVAVQSEDVTVFMEAISVLPGMHVATEEQRNKILGEKGWCN